MDFDTLHIMPGYHCNFSCSHCVNESGPKRNEMLSDYEVDLLRKTIQAYHPKRLQFTGGEPTLYVELINELIESHGKRADLEVYITTNGWYGSSYEKTKTTLDQFSKLDNLLLSFDIFHRKKMDTMAVDNLKRYCENNEIDFVVSVCLSEPKDLLKAKEILSETGVQVIFQKVESSGRARLTNTQFKYPSYDRDLIKVKCPNVGVINYIANKGFTNCCSNLAFNHDSRISCSRTLEEYFKSDFANKINSKSIDEILRNSGVNTDSLSPEFSSPCRACEFAFVGK